MADYLDLSAALLAEAAAVRDAAGVPAGDGRVVVAVGGLTHWDAMPSVRRCHVNRTAREVLAKYRPDPARVWLVSAAGLLEAATMGELAEVRRAVAGWGVPRVLRPAVVAWRMRGQR